MRRGTVLWIRRACLVLLIVTSRTLSAAASSGEEHVPIGPRPLAMGGAFVAVSEGIDALYWNPAGLGRLRVSSLRATNANLHGLDIQDNSLTFATPLFDELGVGLEWYHSGFDDGVLQDTIDRVHLGVGWRPLPRLTVGAGLKWRQHEQAYEGIEEGRGDGWGLDLGAMLRPHRRVTVGGIWRDVGGSTLEYDDRSQATPYDQFVTVGIAVDPLNSVTVATDLGRDAHAGVAWRVLEPLELRGGWTKDLDGLDDARLSMGFGVRYGPAQLEYTFQDHPRLDPTHHLGLSIDFTLAPKLLEIQDIYMDPLFASFYKTYATEAPGEITISSLAAEPIAATIRVDQPDVMSRANEREVYILPGVAQRIPLNLVLDPRIVALGENRPLSVDVEVVYQSSGRRRSEKRQVTPMVYDAGLLNWGAGVERAAAFITPSHPLVHEFTRRIFDASADRPKGLLTSRTATLGARLFDGLAACGLRYVPDPLNPYGSVRGKPFAVDSIQYPAELLARRSGDCDDSTVLYASMLANVGIRTALVDVPGHIFLMFDTGIPARDREFVGVDPGLFVLREGSLWIPVETTSLGEPFHVAWRKGAELFRRHAGTPAVTVVDTRSAQRRFEPALSAARVRSNESPPEVNAGAVAEYLARDLAEIDRLRQDYVSRFEREHLERGGVEGRSAVARLHYRQGNFDRAGQELESIPEDERDASVWNNLGTVLLAQGRRDEALVTLGRARTLDPDDPGIALNRGIALHLAQNDEQARQELQESVRLSQGVEEAMTLLSLLSTGGDDSRGVDVLALEQLALQSIESLVEDAARSLQGSRFGSLPGAIVSDDQQQDLDETASLGTAPGDSLAVGRAAAAEAEADQADAALTVSLRDARIEPASLAEVMYWKLPGSVDPAESRTGRVRNS